MNNFGLIIVLLVIITFLSALSNKYKLPYPVILVICGILLSLIPGLPTVPIDPDIVFVIILPPLLFSASWQVSWHNFKKHIRPIGLAAIGLVFFTTLITGIVLNWLIPGLGLPYCFLVGAIVSPPDAIASSAIIKGLNLNPRIIAILEGESLINDASGLVVYKYALLSITTGSFAFTHAAANFLFLVVLGLLTGFAVGYLISVVLKKIINDALIEVTLLLLTPFISYLLAEYLHGSGILAVVTSGLFLSYRSGAIFTHKTRLMTGSLWEIINFLLNSIIFILLGLQLRNVLQGIGNFSTAELILYGSVTSVLVIIIRFLWVIPSAYIPRWLSKTIRQSEEFDPKNIIVVGWSGIRGVVSMAAAIALPMTLGDGTPFQNRSLIIYLTFCVIVTTLLLVGITLRPLIRKLKIAPYSIIEQEFRIREKITLQTLTHIKQNLNTLPEGIAKNIHTKYTSKYIRLHKSDLPPSYFEGNKYTSEEIFNKFLLVQMELINLERKAVNSYRKTGGADDEILRKIEQELDYEQTSLQMELYTS